MSPDAFFGALQEIVTSSELPEQVQDAVTRFGRGKQGAICATDFARQAPANGRNGRHEPRQQVEPTVEGTHGGRGRHEPEHRAHEPELPEREREGVAHHEGAIPVGSHGRGTEADRPARVVKHERDGSEIHGVHEPGHGTGVLLERQERVTAGHGQPEARVVERHAPEPLAQRCDELAVHEGRGGCGVQEEQDGPSSLVDVVDAVPVDIHVAALKRKVLGRPGCPT